MPQAGEYVAKLLALSKEQRADAARVLLDSLDENDADVGAHEAQVAELVARMKALDDGTVELIDGSEARARVAARLRAIRGQ